MVILRKHDLQPIRCLGSREKCPSVQRVNRSMINNYWLYDCTNIQIFTWTFVDQTMATSFDGSLVYTCRHRNWIFMNIASLIAWNWLDSCRIFSPFTSPCWYKVVPASSGFVACWGIVFTCVSHKPLHYAAYSPFSSQRTFVSMLFWNW